MENATLWGLIGTIFGVILSIASIWFAIYTNNKNKKKDRTREYLYEIADQNIDKTDKSKEVEKLKKEAKTLDDKIATLESKLKNEIPKEAKKVILKDRLNEAKQNLYNYYKEIKDIEKDLKERDSAEIDIPESLYKEIEKEILPQYVRKEKLHQNQMIITILTAFAAICFALPFYPISQYIGYSFAFFVIFPFINIIKYYLPNIKRITIYKVSLISLGVLGSFFLLPQDV